LTKNRKYVKINYNEREERMKNKHKIFIKEIIIFIVLTVIVVKFLVG